MAVTGGFLASLWVCSAANAAFLAARLAYGEASTSPAAVATKEVAVFFSVLMGLFLHAVVLMCLSLCWRLEVQAREVRRGRGAGSSQLPQGTEGRDEQLTVPGAAVSLVVVLFFVVLVCALMRSGEMLYFVFLLNSLIFCCFTCPALTVVAGCAASDQTAQLH